MTALGHPTRRRLRAWITGLDTGTDRSLDRHLERCNRCTSRLEEMAPASTDDLRGALRAVLAPPDELVERLRARLVDAIGSRDDLKLVLEMFGLPADTVRILLTQPEAPRSSGNAASGENP